MEIEIKWGLHAGHGVSSTKMKELLIVRAVMKHNVILLFAPWNSTQKNRRWLRICHMRVATTTNGRQMVKFNLVTVNLDCQLHRALDSMKRQAPGFMCEEEALPQERVASLAVTKYKEFKGKISSCLVTQCNLSTATVTAVPTFLP